MIRAGALAAGITLAALPAHAVECRLALALAVDISSSVDAVEDRLQRSGIVAALKSATGDPVEYGQEIFLLESIGEGSK